MEFAKIVYFWHPVVYFNATKNAIQDIMRKTILSLLAASLALTASAVPAKRGPLTITQPDGTTMQVLLRGDEHRHIYLTLDSLPMLEGADGFMQYAAVDAATGRVAATGIRATSDPALRAASERAAAAGIDAEATLRAAFADRHKARRAVRRAPAQSGLGLFDSSFPVKGDVKAVVILVNYKDVQFSTPNASQYFSDMLMKEGFSEYGATGSAYDYFIENSMGQFRPQFDCYGPVTLPQNRSYYGGNNVYGEDKNAERMIADAVSLLDDEVDFSQYDTDGDGYIDNVFVFYAGMGEASGGSSDTVWPHAYYVESGAGITCVVDGVRLDRYACSNEWEGGKPDGIGTFVHEFSHVMGLPDLYDTEGSLTVTPDTYSVLDYGPYNNNGRTPPAYSAFERNALGWNEPHVLDGPASVSLAHIAESNESYLIPTEKTNEFFLLENRQQTGWDTYIPGHGMLIWHIDYNKSVWMDNAVNNTRSHQYVDIVEAGGSANSQSSSVMRSYTFPGSKNVTSFTSTTTPALKSWAGKAIDLPVTGIKESAGVITFDVAGGDPNSGLTDVAAAAAGFRTEGLAVVYEGEAGTAIGICDLAGRRVATAVADASGSARVDLPAGIYIAVAGSATAKLAVR